MRWHRNGAIALTILLAVGPTAAAAQLNCGDSFTGKQVLTADLDCTGVAGPALIVDDRGRLELAGFTVRGGFGVRCNGRCRIDGPGEITESTQYGVRGERITLRNVSVTFNAFEGVSSTGRTRIKDSTITRNDGDGVSTSAPPGKRDRTLIRRSSVIVNGRNGVRGKLSVRIVDSTVSNNGQEGVAAQEGSVAIIDSTVQDNAICGVVGERRIRSVRSMITGNGIYGIASDLGPGCGKERVSVTESTLTGNGTHMSCGSMLPCADVAACRPPKVSATTCGTSYMIEPGLPMPWLSWGVCSLD